MGKKRAFDWEIIKKPHDLKNGTKMLTKHHGQIQELTKEHYLLKRHKDPKGNLYTLKMILIKIFTLG